MEVRRRARDVAKRRDLEGAAEVEARRKILALRATEAEVEERRVGISRNLRVSRRAHVVVGEIGEERRCAVVAAPVRVAGRAITLLRVLEERKSALLLRRQPRLAGKVGVVLAVEAVKIRILDLELRDRRSESREGRGGVVERIRSEDLAEVRGVWRSAQPRDDVRGRGIGHFARVEEGQLRLLDE